ncbi:T-complex protein 11-domain-containing protein [Geopyxis carbonaria]|nr:T-complex protein 11-domain-containing protein [Geopyxis carbonaria]
MLQEIPDSEPPSSVPQWNPPPHLEARFSRRRGRRNGTLSPSTPYNSQKILTASVLATTRRQILLEARKSLLRARAQHVERVRRSRANSVSERLIALQASMSAAQKSRDAILAKIAGSCASEVAKAKRTAVEMRKRREEETRALKETVEERMAEAERRRQEVLSERGRKRKDRGSTGSLKIDGSSDEEVIKEVRHVAKLLKREDAARKILKAWRQNRDRKILEDFAALELTIESVRDAEFMAISSKFQEEEVLRATSRLLKRCGILDNLEGVDGAVEKAGRTFLSAYLILGHPAEVLSNDGEKALITKSKDLLIEFESFISSPSFPPPDNLYSTWSEFSMAFDQWKSRDSEIFINTMLAQYAELDLIWQKVKDDVTGGVAEDFKEGIRENQLILLVRIRRLAGERTRDLIRKTVKEARRTRLPKKPKGDTKPREAPSSDVVTVSATIPVEPQPEPSLPQEPAQVQSQASFDTVSTQNGPSNREIIHELALDRDFRLKPRKRNSLEQMVEDIARKAFWDTMRGDITEGKLEKWIPVLADTVRSKILRLLDPKGALHRAVSDSIDVQLITQQCHAGSYDHEKLLTYVLDLLPKICSPARDDDVKALCEANSEDYTSRLQKLFDVLEAMQLDHSNFLLMLSAMQIIPEAVPYEKRMFAADIAAGRTSLDVTRTWLLAAKSELPAGSDPKVIHTYAFLNLLFGLESLDTSKIPETFHLDHHRIIDTRKILQTVVLGGAISVTIKTLLRRDVRGLWKDLKARVNTLLSADSTHEQVAEGVRVFIESTGAVPNSTLDAVKNAVLRILSRGREDPVVRVVGNRIRGFVKERLLASSSAEKVRLAAAAGEALAGWGVGEWIGEVGSVVDLAQVWRGIDIQVAGQYYNQILGVEGSGVA